MHKQAIWFYFNKGNRVAAFARQCHFVLYRVRRCVQIKTLLNCDKGISKMWAMKVTQWSQFRATRHISWEQICDTD